MQRQWWSYPRVATLALVVAIAAGCGSTTSSNGAPPASSAGTAAGSSATNATTATTVTATGGGALCSQLASYINSTESLGTNPTPAAVMASDNAAIALGQEAVGEAPSSIKADLQTVVTATAQYFAAIAAAGYVIANVPSSAVTSTIGTPQVLAADMVVDAYVKNTCGITTPTG